MYIYMCICIRNILTVCTYTHRNMPACWVMNWPKTLYCCLVKNRPFLRQELSEPRMMERPAVFSCFSGFEIIWLFGVCITRIITSPCLSTGCCWKSTTRFGVSDPTNGTRGSNLAKMPINSRRKVGKNTWVFLLEWACNKHICHICDRLAVDVHISSWNRDAETEMPRIVCIMSYDWFTMI